MRPCSASLGGRRRCPWALRKGSRRSAYSRGAFRVALPDPARHVDGLCQPVRGDDVQPGARVEEEQEVNDLRRHGEVA